MALEAVWDRLMPHQRDAVTWLCSHPRALLADDVGLGKTITGLALIDQLRCLEEVPSRPTGTRALVITDAALITQWAGEAARFVPHLKVATADSRAIKSGSHPIWAKEHPAGLDVLIVGHEFASRRTEQLDGYDPELVLIDEASALKGGEVRHSAVRALTEPAHRRAVAMTATALETNPMELWYLLDAVHAPALWPEAWFAEHYVEWKPAKQLKNGGELAARALGWLPGAEVQVRAYLQDVALRRTSTQAGLVLPEVEEHICWVPLTPEQLKEYQPHEERGGLWGSNKCEEISRRPCPPAVADWLGARPEVPKAIVYAQNHERLNVLARMLEARRIDFTRIDGTKNDAERERALARFRDDPDTRVLLGSKVLERGLNLQHCRVLLSLDSSWNPAREAQRVGRICRIGSPHASVQHVTFLGDVPITRRKVAQLNKRRAMTQAVGL